RPDPPSGAIADNAWTSDSSAAVRVSVSARAARREASAGAESAMDKRSRTAGVARLEVGLLVGRAMAAPRLAGCPLAVGRAGAACRPVTGRRPDESLGRARYQAAAVWSPRLGVDRARSRGRLGGALRPGGGARAGLPRRAGGDPEAALQRGDAPRGGATARAATDRPRARGSLPGDG